MRCPASALLTALTLVFSPISLNAAAADAGAFPAALEAVYLERFAALRDRSSRTGLAAYDPLVPVQGAADWQPLPRRQEGQRRVPGPVLDEAQAYAAANRSSAFIVWVDGAVDFERYYGDSSATSLLVSKSLAKPLAVIAVGRAVQEGLVASLDQPLADFIAAWRDDPRGAITLRQLLGNRSGLLPQAPAPTADDVLNRAYLHPAHDQVIVREYPLVDPPGSRYEYSNANTELVAPVLEAATGMAYEDWLSREVLQPLGALGGEVWMNRDGGTPHAGCCILLPAETYLRLALLLLDDGVWEGRRLLSADFVKAMRSPSAQNPHAGLGVYLGSPYIERRGAANPDRKIGQTLHSEPYAADDLYLFDGNSNQVVYIVPSRRTVILRTGNWPPRDPEWDNARLANGILRALRPAGG